MNLEDVFAGVKTVFLDTAPVIYYVEATEQYAQVVREIFRRLDEGQFQAVTSPVTLAECLVVPSRLGQLQFQKYFIDLLTGTDAITFTKIGAKAAQQSAELRFKYGLKLPDALQIATAIGANCDAFLTNDLKLKRVTELRVLVVNELEL